MRSSKSVWPWRCPTPRRGRPAALELFVCRTVVPGEAEDLVGKPAGCPATSTWRRWRTVSSAGPAQVLHGAVLLIRRPKGQAGQGLLFGNEAPPPQRIPEDQGIDVTGPFGHHGCERRTDAHANGSYPGQAAVAKQLHGALSATQPGFDPVGISRPTGRITGPVVVEARDCEAAGRQLLREHLKVG